jgi:hypothetical protein
MQRKHGWYWALVSSALMVVGGFGPWATVLVFSVSGTNGDGWLLIVGGLLAGGLLAFKRTQLWPLVISGLVALAGLATAIYDLANLSSVADDGFLEGAVSPGWGLYLCLLASGSLLAASVVTARLRTPPVEPSVTS